jgi:HSP20 family protein
MSLIKWEPRSDFDTLTRGMRRLFEDFDSNFGNLPNFAPKSGAFLPSFDINEDKENIYFIADIPGVKQEDVKVTVSEGVLTIRGEKKREEKHHDRNFYRMERSYGEFVRQFTLPEDVKDEEIVANFEHGVLEITVPKREPSKPKEREVKIGMSTNGHAKEIAQNASQTSASSNGSSKS